MQREPTGEWCLLGDKVLTSVCCNSEKNIVGCNSAGEVWRWDGEEWTMLSDSPTMSKCSVGSDGTLCVVESDNEPAYIWSSGGGGTIWSSIGGAVSSLAVLDATHIYVVGVEHTTYGHLWMYDGGSWTSIEGTTEINFISVAKDGSLFAILHSDSSLVKWSGTAWGSSLGSATGLKAIAAKSGTMVWAVGSDDKLYYWNGLTWTKSSDDTVSGIALAMI